MKRTHWLLIAVLVLFCNLVVAQRIEGRVFDKQNNQPLNNAQIDLFSRTGKKLQSVSTDFNGNYYYQGPDAQEVYKVAGRAQGYTTAEVIVNSGANGTLVIFGLVQNEEDNPYSNPVSSSAQGLNIAPRAFESNDKSKQKQEQTAKEIADLNQKHQSDFPHNVAALQSASTSSAAKGVYNTNAVVSPSSSSVASPSINYATTAQNQRQTAKQEKDNFTTIQTPQGAYTTNTIVNQESYQSIQARPNGSVASNTVASQSYQDTSTINKGNTPNETVMPATKLVPATRQKDNKVSYERANEVVDFIYFDFNSSYFNSSHDFELMQIVNHLLKNSQHNINLTMYVDRNSPNFEYQHWLNQRRVQRIQDYLVANGVHRSRINLRIQDLSSNPTNNVSVQRILRQCGFEISA